jgi:hypothetical protein
MEWINVKDKVPQTKDLNSNYEIVNCRWQSDSTTITKTPEFSEKFSKDLLNTIAAISPDLINYFRKDISGEK